MQLVATREREMNYMLGRYQAIGTQSALVSGFAIGTLTNIDIEEGDVSSIEMYIFYISSMLTVLASMQTILTTVFVCNWAPGLALRGPTGSMSRAYDATRGQRRHINVMYIASLFGFVFQTDVAVSILDDSPGVTVHGIIAAFLGLSAMAASAWYAPHARIPSVYHARAGTPHLRLASALRSGPRLLLTPKVPQAHARLVLRHRCGGARLLGQLLEGRAAAAEGAPMHSSMCRHDSHVVSSVAGERGLDRHAAALRASRLADRCVQRG